jgi:hypothetical protein
VGLLDAGVVEGQVELAEAVDGLLQGGGDVVGAGDVALDSQPCPPWCSISCAVSWMSSAGIPAMATLAPSAAKASAVARPMPAPAPVTNATLPANWCWLFGVLLSVPFAGLGLAVTTSSCVVCGCGAVVGQMVSSVLMARRSSMAL